jgi:serine/threonine-protein kinase RsbW
VRDRVHGRAELRFVETVHDLLDRDLPRAPEIGPEDKMPFELAVVEVVTNAAQHAQGEPAGADVELDFELEIHPDLLLARLYEIGAGPFDLPAAGALMPGHDEESGRGLALARQLLSTISCERSEGSNLWTLTRRPGSSTPC